MTMPRCYAAACASVLISALTACSIPTPSTQTATTLPQSAASGATNLTRPQDAPDGTCWGKSTTPAVIETTTERVLITPADIGPEGTIRTPAQYRNEDRQTIVTPRQIAWYETVCPEAFTPQFTATLQRALSARGYYTAPVTSQLDAATKDAIALYQAEQNLSGFELSRAAAQQMGLVAVRAEDL